MKTYLLEFSKKGNAIFINEEDNKDKIKANEILRFNTAWTGSHESYKDVKGFFESCNCFKMESYGITFFELSACGEELTTKN